jgi:hypothetical protein
MNEDAKLKSTNRPALTQLYPPSTVVEDDLAHAPFLQTAHRLCNVILGAIEPQTGHRIANHIRDGLGVLTVTVNATAQAGWSVVFHPSEGWPVPLAYSSTEHAAARHAGLAMMECVTGLLMAAVQGIEGDEDRVKIAAALTEGTHGARVRVDFGPVWEIHITAHEREGKEAVRFALITEAIEQLH